jgi:hypothetical protein
VGDDFHAEGTGATGDFDPDFAEADYAQRLRAQFRSL